jgi:hypothetical protein
MNEYKHYISLGYFCSVAMELEKYGLRDASYPFDWLITDFEGVMDAISNHFSDYLLYDNLYQNKDNRSIYFDKKYKFSYVHDFNKYRSLSSQIDQVKEKYDRRIARFYENISEPTLFIRYISDEVCDEDNKSEELKYIENNIEEICRVIRQFNPDNEIIWIANEGVYSDVITIYNVQPDVDDTCCRKPIDNIKVLRDLFNYCDISDKMRNLERYEKKQKNNKRYIVRAYKRVMAEIDKRTRKEYIHDKEY